MLDPNIRKEIIMEHYLNPINRSPVTDPKYIKVNTNSETCIDNIDIYLRVEDNVIKDIHFDGEACAISTSSSSIMIKLLQNKTISEARSIIENYYNMIYERPYDCDLLEEANCYEDIHLQQNRIGCATIPWRGLEKALSEYENSKSEK